jgi:hypothetical protein
MLRKAARAMVLTMMALLATSAGNALAGTGIEYGLMSDW